MKIKITLFIIILYNCNFLFSQTCCSGGVPLSNNIGLDIKEKGSWQFGLSYDYNNLNTLKVGTESLNDDTRLRTTHSALLNIGFSITNNFFIEGLFTWVNQRRRIKRENTFNLDQTFGIGDAIILARYKLFSNNNYEFSLGGGLKLPFGSTNNTNNQGILLSADLQPGSNSLDGIFIATYKYNLGFRKTTNILLRNTYRKTGVNREYLNASTYKFGNEFQSFLTVSDQVFLFKQIVSPSLTVKYRNVIRDKIDNNNLQNTGGEWVFLIPNITLNITERLLFSANLEIPLYAKVIGTQLTPTYRITTGFSFLLNKKLTIKRF